MPMYTPLDQDPAWTKKNHLSHIALKQNTYDALTWAFVKMNDPSIRKAKGVIHLTVAFLIPFVLNIVTVLLQIGAIFGLLQFTVARQQDKYTVGLGDEGMREARSTIWDAINNNTALDKHKYDDILSMCEHDHNVPYSQSVMTWVWGMKLLPIISQSFWMMILIIRTQTPTTAGENWIALDTAGKKLSIVRMSTLAKIFVLIIVDLPRLGVGIYLYIMGASFLMYAKNLGTLIMKCIGLSFIATLPDVIFGGAFSEAFQKEIKSVRLSFVEGEHSEEQLKDHDGEPMPVDCGALDNWNLAGASLVKIFGVLIISLYYCRIVCGDLQHLREACFAYKQHFIVPNCPQCGSHIFGMTLYN